MLVVTIKSKNTHIEVYTRMSEKIEWGNSIKCKRLSEMLRQYRTIVELH